MEQLLAKDLMDEATKAVQLRKNWPEKSKSQEELELLRVSGGVRLDGALIRQAMKAGKESDWSELLKSDNLNAWRKVKIQECSNEAKQRGRRVEEWVSTRHGDTRRKVSATGGA